MGGEIYLDEEYDSGLPGQPGTRFVINLQRAPLEATDLHHKHLDLQQQLHEQHQQYSATTEKHASVSGSNGVNGDTEIPTELPENLSVLFVDDDAILRRLFSRTVNRVAPSWKIREAASGEAALRLVEENNGEYPFDLIFMDMYMASVEKSLLGTIRSLSMELCSPTSFSLSHLLCPSSIQRNGNYCKVTIHGDQKLHLWAFGQ